MKSFIQNNYHILNQSGQALVEYMLLAAMSIILTIKIVNTFSGFFRDSLGNLGHVLTINLTVGACERDCFFGGFKNGQKP